MVSAVHRVLCGFRDTKAGRRNSVATGRASVRASPNSREAMEIRARADARPPGFSGPKQRHWRAVG